MIFVMKRFSLPRAGYAIRFSPQVITKMRFSKSNLILEDIPKNQNKVFNFKVDRSGLCNDFGSDNRNLTAITKEPIDDFSRDLKSYIEMRGPITLHEFMSQSTNNLEHGYYQSSKDKIGGDGDFITSPEISQLFGEMITIWCVSCWEELGRPSKINLVELGPGKGTLMKDILRTSKRFADFQSSIDVHMVLLQNF